MFPLMLGIILRFKNQKPNITTFQRPVSQAFSHEIVLLVHHLMLQDLKGKKRNGNGRSAVLTTFGNHLFYDINKSFTYYQGF